MMNFYKTPKLDALNDKFNEFENRFQLKLDEQNTAHKIHIQKLDDKIARLEEENSRTFELIDKLYEYRFKEIHDTIAKLSEQMSGKLNHYINIYDNKLENTFTTLQKVMLLTKEKITVITDKVEICMNDVKNFEEQINTLTKQQEATNEKLVALNNTVSVLDDKIDVHVCELYEKIDETINKEIDGLQNTSVRDEKLWDDIKTINEKIDGLEEKQSLTGELLLDVQNEIIMINTHSKLGNTSQQNLNNEFSGKIKIITDNVSNIQNINNKFDREIHTLTTRQHITTENLNALQQHINTWGCIVADNLEICMNSIKLINVFEEPLFKRQITGSNQLYDSTNRYLGTSIILLDNEPYEFSYINQFYNLKVLVINNWSVFNFGAHPQTVWKGTTEYEAPTFTKMLYRYGKMNNKTLETFIIHSSYDFITWGTNGATNRKEPLMLEYLCMQLKNFPSLKIVKLYYLDLPKDIEDIIINNLENMTHKIKELHIISNTYDLQTSKIKRYCNTNNIMFVVPKLNEFISLKDKSGGNCFNGAVQWDVIEPLKHQLIDEGEGYMRRHKITDSRR
jgi:hypothetical protein